MDLLNVRVAADDVLHAVQILAALVNDEVRAVIREGRRRLKGDARTGEEILDGDFFGTLSVTRTSTTGSGSAERISGGTGGRSTGGRGATAGAQARHLKHGSRR